MSVERWEYRRVEVKFEGNLTVLMDALNGLGRGGWEAWHLGGGVTFAVVFLKRPIEGDSA